MHMSQLAFDLIVCELATRDSTEQMVFEDLAFLRYAQNYSTLLFLFRANLLRKCLRVSIKFACLLFSQRKNR